MLDLSTSQQLSVAAVSICTLPVLLAPRLAAMDVGMPLPLFRALRVLRKVAPKSILLRKTVRRLRLLVVVPIRVAAFVGNVPRAIIAARLCEKSLHMRTAAACTYLLSRRYCDSIAGPMVNAIDRQLNGSVSPIERQVYYRQFFADLMANVMGEFEIWWYKQWR